MTHEQGPLLDEHVLRRALRLDADEVPPRLDPALIAAAASAPRHMSGPVAGAVVVAFIGGWAWSEVLRAVVGVVGASGLDPLGLAIDALTSVAPRLLPIVETATQPVVPIAILAAAMIAALFEQRGRTHAAPS